MAVRSHGTCHLCDALTTESLTRDKRTQVRVGTLGSGTTLLPPHQLSRWVPFNSLVSQPLDDELSSESLSSTCSNDRAGSGRQPRARSRIRLTDLATRATSCRSSHGGPDRPGGLATGRNSLRFNRLKASTSWFWSSLPPRRSSTHMSDMSENADAGLMPLTLRLLLTHVCQNEPNPEIDMRNVRSDMFSVIGHTPSSLAIRAWVVADKQHYENMAWDLPGWHFPGSFRPWAPGPTHVPRRPNRSPCPRRR